MKNHQASLLHEQLAESFLFTPYLGANVSIHSDRWGVWHGACGYSNPRTRVPIQTNQRFYIYSITKTFTAAIILRLIENNHLSLEDPVFELLPEIKLSELITVRHLLNHTSGLFNYTEEKNYKSSVQEQPEEPWSEQTIINLLERHPLDFEPGKGWHYSNTGYFVLKKIIESVSQSSYQQALQRYVCDPLNLSLTKVAEDIPDPKLTPGYSRDLHPQKLISQVNERFHPGWCQTGLITSTAHETALFYHKLFKNELLAPKFLQELCQPIEISPKDPRFGNPCYGLGVMIDTKSPYGMMYGHGGEGPGYNPWVMHLPDFQGSPLTMAIMTNFNAGAIPFLLISDLLARVATF